MFCHILRCDWWFTSYEWNANNSVRAHSNTTHWQAHRVCFMLSVFESIRVCMRKFLSVARSFVRSSVLPLVLLTQIKTCTVRPCEKGSVFATYIHTIWNVAFAHVQKISSLFCIDVRVYWMLSWANILWKYFQWFFSHFLSVCIFLVFTFNISAAQAMW